MSVTTETPSELREPERFGAFDFDLTEADEKRAADLHQSSIVVDMLNQHPGGYRIYREAFLEKKVVAALEAGKTGFEIMFSIGAMATYEEDLSGKSNILQRWWDQSGITVGTFSIAIGDIGRFSTLFRLSDSLPWFRKAVAVADIRRAKADGAHAFYGNCQPVYGLPRDPRLIVQAYEMGLRSLMLTYNSSDFVGCGCTDRIDHGLSNYGVSVVSMCNEMGIIVDTSHCGRETTLDACRLSKRPVTANHTSASGVYAHARAKSDDEIRAIADTGGIVGVYAVPFFVASRKDADINDMLDHIDYIVGLVGWRHVGIGTDWPMTAPKQALPALFGAELLASLGFRPEHNFDVTRNLIGFDDYRDFPNITRGLVKRGYDDEQIKGILGENFLRVFGEVCG